MKCNFILNTVIFISAALNISLRKFRKCNVLWFYLFGQGVPNETKGSINLNFVMLRFKWDKFVQQCPHKWDEPRHDKTNKMSKCPARTQICLGIRPVWSESSLSARRKLGSLATHQAQAKILFRLGGCPGWSESSLCAQSLCWFCHVAAQIFFVH